MSPITKIRAGSQLRSGSVDSNIIKDYGVLSQDITPGSLTGDVFLDGSISIAKLGDGATKLGNVFNGPNQLVKLDASGSINLLQPFKTESYLELKGMAAPGAPDSGYGRLFMSPADNLLHFVNDEGQEIALGPGGTGNVIYADHVVPSGIMNGINKNFTLSQAPDEGSLHVYMNGLRLAPGQDYVSSSVNIILEDAPLETYQFRVDYRITIS
jgi:hypothetical protein